MNKSSATIMAAALMLASSCTEVKQEGQGYEPIIGKQEITIKDGRLTPEALWAMGRIGSLSISHDGFCFREHYNRLRCRLSVCHRGKYSDCLCVPLPTGLRG